MLVCSHVRYECEVSFNSIWQVSDALPHCRHAGLYRKNTFMREWRDTHDSISFTTHRRLHASMKALLCFSCQMKLMCGDLKLHLVQMRSPRSLIASDSGSSRNTSRQTQRSEGWETCVTMETEKALIHTCRKQKFRPAPGHLTASRANTHPLWFAKQQKIGKV